MKILQKDFAENSQNSQETGFHEVRGKEGGKMKKDFANKKHPS